MWKRVGKTLVALGFGEGISFAEKLILIPLFLIRWSPIEYGNWLSLVALVGFFNLFDLGMHTGGAIRLTQVYAKGETEKFEVLRHSAMAFYLWLAMLGTFILTVSVFTVGGWQLGEREMILTPTIRWTFWLLGLQALWAMPYGFLVSTHRIVGDMAATQWVVNGREGAAVAAVAVVLALGADMDAVAGVELAVLLLSAGVVFWNLKRRSRVGVPGISRASFSGLKELIVPSLSFWVVDWNHQSRQNLPVLLIRMLVGEIAVATFVVSRTLVILVHKALSLIYNALWPEITQLEARGELASLRLLHRRLLLGSSVFVIVVAGILWFVGDSAIRIWTRGRLPSDPLLLRMWLVYLVLQVPWMASALFPQAANRVGTFARAFSVSTLIGISVAALLMGRLKSSSVPLGFIVGEALACYHFIVRETCGMLKEPYGIFARWFWKGWGIIGLGALGAGWAISESLDLSVPSHWLFLTGGICSTVFLLAWWLWVRNLRWGMDPG